MLVILNVMLLLACVYSDLPPETWMKPDEIIKYEGYPCEVHKVRTEDGYILTIHRIPHYNSSSNPIVFCHGFTSGPKDALLLKNYSFPFILWKAGFDVWLLSLRASQEACHPNRPKNSYQYWNFGVTEHGMYDVPASIDYILQTTQRHKLIYIGHSMGSTSIWIACNERQDIKDKISIHLAVNPAYGMSNFKRLVMPFVKFGVASSLETSSMNHFVAPKFFQQHYSKVCGTKPESNKICLRLANFLNSTRQTVINKRMLALIFAKYFGISSKQLLYFMQITLTDKLLKKDDFFFRKLKNYGPTKQDEYDVKACRVPTVIYYGENDVIVTPQDIQNLKVALEGSIYSVPKSPEWINSNHFGLIFSPTTSVAIAKNFIETIEYFKKP